jgi:hypothetical protein
MRALSVVLLCTFLCSCVANRAKQYSATLASWVGSDISEVIVTWGPPTTTYRMPDGRIAYTWERYGGAVAMPVGNAVYAVGRSCTTTLIAGANNTVERWQFRGNAC